MSSRPSLLLLHPVGVGLSHHFWDRFINCWHNRHQGAVMAPDLLGCGAASTTERCLTPRLWAEALRPQLQDLNQPAVVVVQGGSLPIALELINLAPEACAGLVMVGPPGWRVMGEPANPWLQRLLWWGLFQGLSGRLFWRWARREAFLSSFSKKELFAVPEGVDQEWLDQLRQESADSSTRWAVFAFLAGFWRRNYHKELRELHLPVLALVGESASGISRSGRRDTSAKKLADYGAAIDGLSSRVIPGRNVLPYESSAATAAAIDEWIQNISAPKP